MTAQSILKIGHHMTTELWRCQPQHRQPRRHGLQKDNGTTHSHGVALKLRDQVVAVAVNRQPHALLDQETFLPACFQSGIKECRYRSTSSGCAWPESYHIPGCAHDVSLQECHFLASQLSCQPHERAERRAHQEEVYPETYEAPCIPLNRSIS